MLKGMAVRIIYLRDKAQMSLNLPIYNNEGGNMLRSCELRVTPGHDEPYDTLGRGARSKRISWTNPITNPSTQTGAGNIKECEDSVPTERFPQRRGLAQDDIQPSG